MSIRILVLAGREEAVLGGLWLAGGVWLREFWEKRNCRIALGNGGGWCGRVVVLGVGTRIEAAVEGGGFLLRGKEAVIGREGRI